MTHQEILEKAIEKAIENGWNKEGFDEVAVSTGDFIFFNDLTDNGEPENFSRHYSYQDLIFSHPFAKALWGERLEPNPEDYESHLDPNWKIHLQQMVISEDPIKYLGDNI